jgi:Zn ribbon nucleic-acid-binding protein
MAEMRKISAEDVEGYLKVNGEYCPFCKSPEIQEDTMMWYDEDTVSVHRGMTCLTCFRDWTEVFKLSDIKEESYKGLKSED